MHYPGEIIDIDVSEFRPQFMEKVEGIIGYAMKVAEAADETILVSPEPIEEPTSVEETSEETVEEKAETIETEETSTEAQVTPKRRKKKAETS